jgi:fimbrial chaperone protein
MIALPWVLLAALAPWPALAFQVSPLSVDMQPAGPQSSTTFDLENNADRPIPIEVSINNRKIDVEGRDIPDDSISAEDKFIVYPPQFILDAKSRRSVRITWVGGGSFTDEQAFRVNFQELALPTKKEKAPEQAQGQISLLFRYTASVFIVPPGATGKLVVASAQPDPKDNEKLVLSIENQGTAHQMLRGFKVSLRAQENGSPVELTDKDVAEAIRKNVLAKSRINLTMPWPSRLKKGPLQAIVFEPKS